MAPAPADRKQIDVEIGKAVERARDPLSQKELADQMRGLGHKWSQATVWAVEKGDRPLKLSEAFDLSNLFHIAIEELLASAEETWEAEWAMRSIGSRLEHEVRALGTAVEQLRDVAEQFEVNLESSRQDLPESRLTAFRELLDEKRREIRTVLRENLWHFGDVNAE
ncbi:hypothetical protein [Aeromicrobium sp. JJY06]|uniref:hypothetical protein n=1 Tax=Aeromicrobium sp. JJY06 TaxID=3373478 RepID=UPI00376ED7AC